MTSRITLHLKRFSRTGTSESTNNATLSWAVASRMIPRFFARTRRRVGNSTIPSDRDIGIATDLAAETITRTQTAAPGHGYQHGKVQSSDSSNGGLLG
ncbi:hypothetical protein PM082_003772 [Marasmius tenuissimus]|nr:hypothetical protein PM082_003772 [Marasmius tenuissimus]